MFVSVVEVAKYIQSYAVLFIELLFTDVNGFLQHKTFSVAAFDLDSLESGVVLTEFCGLVLQPDLSSAFSSPFAIQQTIVFICSTWSNEHLDWRTVCAASEQKVLPYFGNKQFQIALRFFIVDNVRFACLPYKSFHQIEPYAGANCRVLWQHNIDGGGFDNEDVSIPTASCDHMHDLRSEIINSLRAVGVEAVMHCCSSLPNSGTVCLKANSLLKTADSIQLAKHVVHNVARSYGKNATFMPRINNSRTNNNLSITHSIASGIANRYVSGVLKHCAMLCALAAPMSLGRDSSGNVLDWLLQHPTTDGDCECVEYKFIEGISNPYVSISAVVLAGCDVVENDNKFNGFDGLQHNTSCCVPEYVPWSLMESLDLALHDTEFMTKAIDRDLLQRYLADRLIEAKKMAYGIKSVEFLAYYNL